MNIQVENLDYVYNPGTPLEIRALQDINFSLASGQFLGVSGGTGSGKTTLIKNLNALLVPTRGRVLIGGTDTRYYGPGLRRRVGVVFQRPERQLFEETVFKDIAFVLRRSSGLSDAEVRDKVHYASKLLRLDIDKVGERSPMALSDGEKRKVAIAAILVNDPEILVLDEPAVSLDPPSVSDLVRLLEEIKKSKDRSVVIVSHDMEPFLPLLDYLMILHQGRIVTFGSPAEVCDALAGDPAMRELLPGLAVLVHELRLAGYQLPPNEFRIPVLLEELSDLIEPSGGHA